ncbi:hypothetical protein O181_083553 [Austropuccinia psidii MF-1]|uniref:Uncharacterized protein n=1 Tax=Austropuccinia psidii MF-1 TaxID=1389203 RepID=A0A9Q3FTW5_9BASI|nr:hypothetical protein [Austropuccinia psidii MF-1]
MRRVDEEIAKAKNIEGKKSQKHECVESKTPNLTAFGRAPQGLPIDFYDPEWYNDLTPAQKTVYGDTLKVPFSPNALQSIRGVQHPNEKLGDKRFTEKHWEKATEKYDLSHEITAEDEDDESNSDFQDIDSDSSSNDGSLSREDSNMEELAENSNPYDEDKIMEEDSQTHTSQNVGTSKNFGYGYNWENWE